MVFLVFLLVIGLGVALIATRSRVSNLESQVSDLRFQVRQINARQHDVVSVAPTPVTKPQTVPLSPETPPPWMQNLKDFSVNGPKAATVPTPTLPPKQLEKPISAPVRPKAAPGLWETWKPLILENWTGIVGAAIFVLGVAFFGILGSLYLGPEGRFFILVGVAALLFGLVSWVKKFPVWNQIATWLQAAAGAIFLVACVGAGGIEGLKFIQEPLAALAVLGIGILFNLVLAHLVASQSVACLHVVFCLLALMVAPPTSTILVVAGVVTVAGILLSYRHRWDTNLLVSLLGFAIFHEMWFQNHIEGIDAIRFFGVVTSLLVGMAACFVHYSHDYRSEKWEPLPFTVHVLNWIGLSYNLLRYSQGSQITVILMLVAGLAAIGFARYAKQKGIAWLHLLDATTGQLLILFAISQFGRFGLEHLEIAGVMFIETLVFVVVSNLQRERVLLRVGYLLSWISGGLFLFLALDSGSLLSHQVAIRIGVVAAFTLFYQIFATARGFTLDTLEFVIQGDAGEKDKGKKGFALLPAFPALLLIAAFYWLRAEPWVYSAYAGALLILVLLKNRLETLSYLMGLAGSLIFFHVITWMEFIPADTFWADKAPEELTTANLFQFCLPMVLDLFILIAGFSRSTLYGRYFDRLVTYLFCGGLIAAGYRFALPYSDFGPGIFYLGMALALAELARGLRHRFPVNTPRALLPDFFVHGSFVAFGFFLFRHILVHLQSEVSVGPVALRAVIGGLGVVVSLYWFLYPVQEADSIASKFNRAISPLAWEGFLIFLTAFLAYESPAEWQSILWAGVALGLATLGQNQKIPLRSGVYSWFFFVASIVLLSTVSSLPTSPDPSWIHNTANLGVITILLQVGYIFYCLQEKVLWPEANEFPLAFRGFESLAQNFRKVTAGSLLYPFAAGVAIFLFWRFDRAILTLLWVVEIFVLFILGTALRERHFVRFALVAFLVCVTRLLLFDLSQSQILVRALVFVAIGAILLVTNALMKRYKDRIGL